LVTVMVMVFVIWSVLGLGPMERWSNRNTWCGGAAIIAGFMRSCPSPHMHTHPACAAHTVPPSPPKKRTWDCHRWPQSLKTGVPVLQSRRSVVTTMSSPHSTAVIWPSSG
jgi:hypothetical protein